MAQLVKSTKDFDICGGLNPGVVRVSTENSKAEVILARCAILGPATALSRIIVVECDEPKKSNLAPKDS